MSTRIGDVIILSEEPEDICSSCKKKDELRPYGKGGARVCYECAMKDPVEATLQMEIHLFGNVNCTREEAEELVRLRKTKVN